jgi:hypothetical protein
MRVIATVLVALLPVTAFAEENCGRWIRTVTRFRGEVRSVDALAIWEGSLAPVDLDPQFAVTIDVKSAPPEDIAVRAGQKHVFGVHSPSRTFGAEGAVGKKLDLEVQWYSCDGAFGRFEKLRTIGLERRVEDYEGSVEVGHSYRADVQWVEGRLELARPINPVHHFGIATSFENIDAFPELQKRDATRTIVFEVLSQETVYRQEYQWTTLYELRIIQVLPDS